MRRIVFAILVGTCVTPFVGYLGMLFIPDLASLWLLSLLAGLVTIQAPVLAVISFFMPAYIGASLAWPVTLIVLPLAFMVRARVWAPLYGAFVGGVAGALRAY